MIELTCSRFVIGAQRSGTTALRHFISEHPELTVSRGKEVHFFDRWPRRIPTAVGRRLALRSKFGLGLQTKLVDVTPAYVYRPAAIESLAKTVPHARCVMSLRSPVGRAVSQWRLEFNRGTETLPFAEAIARPSGEGHWRNHSYIERGFYDRQLERFDRLFAADQLALVRADALRESPDEALAPVWDVFGVAHVSTKPRTVHQSEMGFEPSPEIVEELIDVFRPSINYVAERTGWDLAPWTDPTVAARL